MKMFREYSQGQIFLLPPSLDEFVPENHEARIINDVVDTMDLSPLLARYEGGGAPAYHPAMMLKAIIYAYSRGIYSSLSIARELKTDTAEVRTVSRDGREPFLEAMRDKLRSEEGRQIYKKRAYTVEPVFGQLKWDGRKLSMDLRGLVKVRGKFLLMCLVHNVKKIVKKVLQGTLTLPGRYSNLIEEAMPGYREDKLLLVGVVV